MTEIAMDRVLANPENWTKDLGGDISTDEFGRRVVAALRQLPKLP
jgi:isocitrate/isopropylmalate dehydrogenase